MNEFSFRKRLTGLALVLCLLTLASPLAAQEILLDKMEKCGDLVCYPSLKDPNQWHYLPDQPRLALQNGKPQFSFLKYARTRETGKAGIGQAEGGGIVHFLVTYGASENRVRQAQKVLQEKHPDATIVGPIVYRKGSFALITSFKEGDTLTTKTVAVGKAPLMEGQKAAVSMGLTREGAELLWESFQTDTPDISLVFDMEFAGVREPFEATLEADWSQISKHHRVKAGVNYKWFGADVDILLQELRQTGAVKITTKGESAPMEKILDSVNNKLLQVMFDPSPTDDISRAAADSNSYNSLNQAVQMLRNVTQSGSGAGTSTGTSGSRSSILFTPDSGHAYVLLWAAILDFLESKAYASSPVETAPSDAPVSGGLETREGTGGDESSAGRDERLAHSRQRFQEGVNLVREGRYTDAIEAFQSSEDLYREITGSAFSNGTIPYNIGCCHFELGNFQQAETSFQEAVNRDPEGRDADQARQMLELTRERIARQGAVGSIASESSAREQVGSTEVSEAVSDSDAYNRARRLHEEARTGGFQEGQTRAALDAYEAYQRDRHPTGSRSEEVAGQIRLLRERLQSATATGSTSTPPAQDFSALPSLMPSPFESNQTTSTGGSSSANTPSGSTSSSGTTASGGSPASSTSSSGSSGSSGSSASLPASSGTASPSSGSAARPAATSTGSATGNRSGNQPGFSLVASYQMKNIKRSGKLVYNLNHFRTETQAFAMSENIGDIFKKYGKDSKIFRAVTIDDPVFKQREILVTLDGQDASTFTKSLNFVTVKMKKQHQAGDQTTGEIVITPDTFNKEGNHFSMTYGWKGDNDRNAWLNYEYQAIWSFFGGVEVRTSWTPNDSPMIALTPPHRYRAVTIEGDGKTLTQAQVRHAVINVNCRIGDQYVARQATIRNNSPAPSLIMDLPEDSAHPETKVSITWHLASGEQVTSPETKLEGDIIYWDQLPKGGAS
jgi:tetratricopeptide (TPR) repeat protein